MQREQKQVDVGGSRPAAGRASRAARLAVGGSLAALPLAAVAAAPATRPAVTPAATRPAAALAPGATPAVGVVASVTAATKPVDTSHTYLLHLPGIAGETQIDHRLVNGMKGAGFAGPTEIYDWTGEPKGIPALTNHERHAAEAQKIADKIVARRKADPTGQILLTGHSGGTGLAVYALEKLPKDVTVDGVLLLSPALSPTYDLSKALAHVRGKAYCFSSSLDVFVLGFGTTLFGTIDGKKGESAGRVGFAKPEAATDPAQYDKLVNCPYDKAWLRFGNIGDHVTVMTEAFTENILAPLVKSVLPGGGGPLTRPTVP